MSKVGRGFFYTHTDDNKLLRENTNNIREKIFEEYYLPYHKKLTDKIVRILNTYNVAHIVDCHSFNDEPLESDTDKSLPRPDICLGTDDYHTPQYLIDFFKNGFENVAIIIVEHDLAILDYMSDIIHLFYGTPHEFGVMSRVQTTKNGINSYLNGFLKTENIQFRKKKIGFRRSVSDRSWKNARIFVEYAKLTKTFEGFQLNVGSGTIY